MSDSTRLLLRIGCFLPLICGPVVTNLISTQPDIQRSLARNYAGMVEALVSGKSIWTTDDLRSLKTAWIPRMPDGKDVLVLGSSRALTIAEEWFQPRAMFNAATMGGNLDEMVAIFELCLENGKAPREVLIELHPVLARKGGPGDMRALAPYYLKALGRYRVLPMPQQASEIVLRLRPSPWPIFAPHWGFSSADPDEFHVHPDGSVFVWYQRFVTKEQVDAAAIEQINRIEPELLHWRSASQPTDFDLKVLRCFLDDLQSRGIRIVVLLPPLHPIAYEAYRKLGGYDETWIRREMASRGIPVVGAYSPHALNFTGMDFHDDAHPRAATVHRLLKDAGVIQSQFRANSQE